MNIDRTAYMVHPNMGGQTTPNGGTIPAALTVTLQKPDITVIDVEKGSLQILELTVPFEDNIHSKHSYKANKYAHFATDITTFSTKITPFEIGVRGFLTKDNMNRHAQVCASNRRHLFITVVL